MILICGSIATFLPTAQLTPCPYSSFGDLLSRERLLNAIQVLYLYHRPFSSINPRADIIFLDGQTKSLTTKEELAYLETVSMLARRGYLIIMTLTAPTMEMFEIIDSVVLLNNDGTRSASALLLTY